MSEQNPFDKTIWDPSNPEQAIEDPVHGSGALLELLAIPPMRKADGTYYVFGAYYLCGTCTFDAEGRPFNKIRSGSSMDLMLEMQAQKVWVESFHAGELPPKEDMDLPSFRYEDAPYLMPPTE